jgi:hypothetical protein
MQSTVWYRAMPGTTETIPPGSGDTAPAAAVPAGADVTAGASLPVGAPVPPFGIAPAATGAAGSGGAEAGVADAGVTAATVAADGDPEASFADDGSPEVRLVTATFAGLTLASPTGLAASALPAGGTELPAGGPPPAPDGTAPLADDAGLEAVGDGSPDERAVREDDVVVRAVSDAVVAGLPVSWSPATCSAEPGPVRADSSRLGARGRVAEGSGRDSDAGRVDGAWASPGGTRIGPDTDGVSRPRPDVGEPGFEVADGGPVSGSGERLTRLSARVTDADWGDPDGDADTGEVISDEPAGVKKGEDGGDAVRSGRPDPGDSEPIPGPAAGWPDSGRVIAGWQRLD